MKSNILIFSLVLLVTACCPWRPGNEKTVFSGQLAGYGKTMVRLSTYSPEGLMAIDSCLTDDLGYFKMEIQAEYPDVYRLSVAANNFTDLVAMPGKKIRVTATGSSLRSPLVVSGSPENDTLLAFDRMVMAHERRLDSVRDLAIVTKDAVSSNAWLNESLELKQLSKDNLRDSVQLYAKKNPSSLLPLVMMAMTFDDESIFSLDHDLESIENQIKRIEKTFRDNSFVSFAAWQVRVYAVDKVLWDLNNQALRSGQLLPAVDLPLISGSSGSMKELTGRIKLIWFWQTGCIHCRSEIEKLLPLYHANQKAGFDIFSIALENDREKILEFVDEWNIPWTVVSPGHDRQDEITSRYNITGTPSGFLIDNNGSIILRDPSPEEIESFITNKWPL